MRTVNDVKIVLYDINEKDNHLVGRFTALPGVRSVEFDGPGELGRLTDKLRGEGLRSKEVIVLINFRGRLLQLCPGSPGMICCRYRLINTCFNCLYDCGYCYLGSYLNSFGIIQFTNTGDILAGLDRFAGETDPSMTYRVGTGEFTDSLMMDEITGLAETLIEHCKKYPNIVLEFKTKSKNIDHLLGIKDPGNTVLAWSLNTPKNIERYEKDTANLEERLEAASRAAGAGYLTAFHFDPVILYPGWEDDYMKIIEQLGRSVDGRRVPWISLGGFRYAPAFRESLGERSECHGLFLEEMFPGRDGKMRYLKHTRREMYIRMVSLLRGYSDMPYVYLCMEGRDMWMDVFGKDFRDSDELERDFSGYLKKHFFSMDQGKHL